MSLQFGHFALDPERRQLLRSGEPVPLEAKAYELLTLLVTRRPRVLSKTQIRDVLWPGTTVGETSLPRLVTELRQALGDDVRKPRFIRTAHGFGYAFCGVAYEYGQGPAVASEPDGESPYPGLLSFTEEDAGRFFGREADVATLWDKLRQRSLLAVIGASGAGKTSFVRAGVVASRPDGWGAIVATPGTSPLRELGRALGPELASDPDSLGKLVAFDDPGTAFDLLVRWRRAHDHALVVIDPLEELFTLNPPEVQARFGALLGRLGAEGDLHVLLSLRDDFLMRCHEHEALRPVFGELTPLGPPTAEGLRRAITEPARRQGYRFEEEYLADEMVRSVEGGRGALPLLAFATARLWEKRDRERRLLTRKAFEEIGGVAGALAQHAEATLERIGPQDEGLVREVFRNLTTAQGTRGVIEAEELLSAFSDRGRAEGVLGQLVDARLLTSYEMDDGEAEPSRHRVEIVHESLLTAWPRLVRWRTQDEGGAQLRDQLRQAARLWHERGRPEDLVWAGTSYLEYRVWRERYPGGLSSLEEDFARAMTALANRRRRHRRIAVAAALATLSIGLGVVAVLWSRSETARRKADAEALHGEASKLLALGRAEQERNPTGALAYATKSLELADTDAGRLFALRLLQEGPTALLAPVAQEDGLEAITPAFSPDGEWLAVGGGTKVQLSHRDGREPLVLPGAYPSTGTDVVHFGFSSDGRRLVGDRFGQVRLCSVPAGQELRRWSDEAGRSRVWARGERFVTSTLLGGQEVIRWAPFDGGDPRRVGSMEARPIWDTSDVDATGTHMAFAQERKVYVRSLQDWASGPRLLAVHPAEVQAVAYHPGGQQLAASDRSGEIRIWPTDGRSETPLRILEATGTTWDIGFSPGGRWLAAFGQATDIRLVRLWDLHAPPSTEPLQFRVGAVTLHGWAFDPSERWLATDSGGDQVRLWPLGRAHSRSLGRHEWVVDDVAITPDGSTLLSVSGGGDQTLRARSLSPDGPEGERILLRAPIDFPSLAVDSSGQRVAVSAMGGRVLVAPISGGRPRELHVGATDAQVWSVAFSPNGRRLAASLIADPLVIRVWDLDTGAEGVLGPVRRGRERRGEGVAALVFLDDDRLLASCFSDGLVLLDLRNGGQKLLSARPSQRAAVGRRTGMVVALLENPDELVKIDLDGGIPELLTPCAGCSSVALDPTETMVATGSVDGVVRIGPVARGEPHLFFAGISTTQRVAFSPDGHWVASSGESRSVRLWPVPDVTKVPFHKRSHEEVLAALHSWTNLRAVKDPQSATGWKLEPGPFPGWEKLPEW